MTETFRAVEPCYHNVTKLASNTVDDSTMDVLGKLLTVAEARALRDWLDLALPCDHKHIDWLTSKCLDCGATLP